MRKWDSGELKTGPSARGSFRGRNTEMVAALLGSLLLAGCGTEIEPVDTETCAADHLISGVCAGVPAVPLCADDGCSNDVPCTAVVSVTDDAALSAATKAAKSGSCIALATGRYGDVVLPGGVRLLGRGAAFVSVRGVVISAGTGALLRGISVREGGIRLDGAVDTRVEAVRVAGSSDDGIRVENGSSLTLLHAEVQGAGRHGVLARGLVSAVIDASIISSAEGPGIWVDCGGGCACSSPARLTLRASIVRDNRIVGVGLLGAEASFDRVEIDRTNPGDRWYFGQYGGGLSVAGCSSLVATDLVVRENASFGLLVDGSTATLGAADPKDGVEINGNRFGIWLQNLPEVAGGSVRLQNGGVLNNLGVGVGLGEGARGVSIEASKICDTKSILLPANPNGSVGSIGIGLLWLEGAQATVDGVGICASGEVGVLLEGAAGSGSELAHVTLSQGDEAKGIVQQGAPAGMGTPGVEDGPSIQQVASDMYPVPAAPTQPVAIISGGP